MPGDYSLDTHTAFGALIWVVSAEGGEQGLGINCGLLPFGVPNTLQSADKM